MPTATVKISHMVQGFQEYDAKPDDSVMRSRVFFSLSIDGRTHDGLHVDLSQPYGTDYEKEPLEVGRPEGYKGPWAHRQFAEQVEAYYRSLIGSSGTGIRIEGGARNIRMINNTFRKAAEFKIEIDREAGAAW